MASLDELRRAFPSIIWDLPLPVAWAVDPPRKTWACRVCIANFGLRADSPHQWPTHEEAIAHIRRH